MDVIRKVFISWWPGPFVTDAVHLCCVCKVTVYASRFRGGCGLLGISCAFIMLSNWILYERDIVVGYTSSFLIISCYKFLLVGHTTTIAGGLSSGSGRRDGPAQNATFSTDFELVYVPKICALLVADRGNRLIRQINLKPEDCAHDTHSGKC